MSATGWELRLDILQRHVEEAILAPLRKHHWTIDSVTPVATGEYLLVKAQRGGQVHKVAVLYSGSTANAVYKQLSREVEHIYVRGGISDHDRKAHAYGIQTPISATQDFYNLMVDWNVASAPGKYAPVASEPKDARPVTVRQLLAENPIDAIWLRLRQLGSVTLSRKLVKARADSAGIPLDEETLQAKAEGVAYAIRNALDYYHARESRNLSQRALNLYYGTMGFVFAEMLAAPGGAKTLAEIEDVTKFGHGLYTVDGLDAGLEHLVVGANANGLFPFWLKVLGTPTSFAGKKPKNASELAPGGAWITVEQLFARIPEISDLFADIFTSPAGWVRPEYDSDANKMFSFGAKEARPSRSYLELIDHSARLKKEDIATLPAAFSEIEEVSTEEPGRHFRVGLDHAGREGWYEAVKIHKSPFTRNALIFPIFGCVGEFRAICVVLLYALSIVVRYRPSIWRRVQEGDLDHMRVLIEAFLAVVERVLPEQFLEQVTGQHVSVEQPGSIFS